jgi:hypothetical protein
MKKVLAIAVILGLSAGAQAASVSFDFGTNFVKWNDTSGATGVGSTNAVNNGRNFTLSWNLDNDLAMGVYNEVDEDPTNQTLMNAIQITKGVVKNVAVGLNIGEMNPVANGYQAVVDVFGSVNILSGTGEKVNGALKAIVAARFSNSNVDADSTNMLLAVSLGF